MSDDVDLDPQLRNEIDRLHQGIEEVDHYSLLGVPRNADKKAVKSAYYAHAARLHPDRHFGKKLGPYKTKMEIIFGRMTIAHDTLASAQRRPEYDAYLEERERLLQLEEALDVETLVVAEEKPVDRARVSDSSQRIQAQQTSPEVEKARREALARRLLGGSSKRIPAVKPSAPPVARTSAPPPTPTPKQHGVETLITSARGAANNGDLITASTRARLAAKLDPRFATEAEELTRRAHAAMAEAYVKQARFEELEERWVAAAISWNKAHEGKPNDPVIAERAANALRLAKGDLHKAVRLAEMAARMRANDAAFRITLAEVYADAGLLKRARSELDVALRINPQEERGRALHDVLRARGA
jgi:curved DNA-binding protein CbpA